MKKIKKGLKYLGLLLLVLAIAFHDLVIYGFSQARGQLKIVYNAVPIQQYLDDPDYPDSLKQKLLLIREVKEFAFDSLGIDYSENYSTMYDQQGKPLMFVVSACAPFQFEPREWSFPLIGTFSYKGFFNEKMAVDLEKKLAQEGLDTNIRTAGGWSTLGWFKDPVLSEMLKRDEGRLAELIIHELTHGTLFVKDSLKFNENLASFIGEQGALRFLKHQYGDDSEELKAYRHRLSDKNKYTQHILRGTWHLDSVYKSMPEDWAEEQKLKVKLETINEIVESIDTLGLNNYHLYRKFLEERTINNTFFMSYVRYQGHEEILKRELRERFKGNIELMLRNYKERYPSL